MVEQPRKGRAAPLGAVLAVVLALSSLEISHAEPPSAKADGAAAQPDTATNETSETHSAPDHDATRALLRSLSRQETIVAQAESITTKKLSGDLQRLKERARAAYKVLRAGDQPLWVARERMLTSAHHRALSRRLLRADGKELALLRAEVQKIVAARGDLAAQRERARTLQPPAPGSLRIPVAFSRLVAPFGPYRHDHSRIHLSRRGITLSSRPGRNVRAVADGQVRYTGSVRGQGHLVVLDHGDYWSILGGLTAGQVHAGQTVKEGDILGESIADEVSLEIRLDSGGGGFPVDPMPLLAWP